MSKHSRSAFSATMIAFAILAAACGGGSGGEALEVDEAAVAAGTPSQLAFTASTVDGTELDVSQFAGQDVALWMWAPW